MFKSWSIRSLLQLWSLTTVLAIILIAVIAIYTNEFFSDTQDHLTEQVLPMENASRQIGSVASSFITRQKQVIASPSFDAITDLVPRQILENEFVQHWQQISSVVSDSDDGKKVVDSLLLYYQRFLNIDSQLLKLIEQQHITRSQLKQKTADIERIEQRIQNQVEAISGRINLQLSRNKRAIRLSLAEGAISSSDSLVESVMFSNQEAIQKLSQSVQLNSLNITNLTHKIIQSNNADNLLSIRENDIRQHESVLKADISQLKQKLQNNDELLELTKNLELGIEVLMHLVLFDDSSIYLIRLQQLENEQLLVVGQQESIEILKVMMTKLNQLSSLVNEQSLKTVSQSAQVADNARRIIIVLGLLIILGMIRFVTSISYRINTPLTELRVAMHALSSENFDTRLKVSSGKSEFAVLATDFNLFADNTQYLIGDLANAKESLEQREQHISAILNGVPEAILTLSASGVIQSTNPAAERVLKANDATLTGLSIFRFFDDDQNLNRLGDLEKQLTESKEFLGRDYNNQTFTIWLSLSPVLTQNDNVWVCVISDITAWKKAEESLKTTSTELDTILENAMVGIAFIKQRKLIRVNNKFEQLFSCKRKFIEGQSAECLYPSIEAFEQLGAQAYEVLQQGENFEGVVQLVRQNGETFWCALSTKAISPKEPHEGSIWLFEDVTIQREQNDKLRELATLDSLTGLPNRGVFNDRLDHAIHKAHRNFSRLAVFFLDLDHFKNINDSLGHRAGDLLLCEVASRLKLCVREGDTVARLGGDEFTIILEDIRSVQYVAKVAEKIFDILSKAYLLDATEVNVSPSIGISLYPADGRDVDILLRNADAAMYHAKKSGRNNFQFYSAEMNAQAAKRLTMETCLRRAVEQNEFCIHLQPQIDLRKGQISGAEALLRWNNEEWGHVSPAEFVPILEDIGLIGEVGEIVLQQACEAYMSLKDQLNPDFQMAVNLSGRQFHGGQLASFIRNQLAKTGMSAKNLELEITESILMDDADLAITTLNELTELGITIAIDDFGTGYSSLSYLKRFPLDVLKIDRSFVRDVNDDEDDAAIVDAILAMSRRLQLDVVAEGVETPEQLAFLQEHDCHRVQGYFFSKPLVLDEFKDFISQDVKYA
jgi:diguanylate cyclase (GGDEF)-like protein/PAS domain S-box-containing protein